MARAMQKHIFSPFDDDLETIQKRLLWMGEQVSQQVRRAVDGFAARDDEQLEEVIRADKRINDEEVALTDGCIQLIVRHHPAANDLRLIMTVLQMITDLERIGDKAKKIAKLARTLITTDMAVNARINLRGGVDTALDMLGKALDAFARLDPSETADIVRQDKALNTFFADSKRELVAYMEKNPAQVGTALDVLFIAKAIERIGDHATNLAEHVVYIVKGHNVRHTALENLPL